VKAGGGMITAEWVLYNTDGGYYTRLKKVFPAVYKGDFIYDLSTTFTKKTPDVILNRKLPASFTIPLEDIRGGTESLIGPKPGATVFYKSPAAKAGLVGWQKGNGRVLNFATLLSATELADLNFKKLFLNAVRWAAVGGAATR
jgi:hypothetical protein